MPDTRYTDLRAVCDYQGLTDEERNHGLDLLDGGPAPVCESYATLLRGALADRGHLLSSPAMAKNRGNHAGIKLLTRLLADHKGGLLDNAEVARGLLALTKPGTTCADLLRMYLQLRQALATRQLAA